MTINDLEAGQFVKLKNGDIYVIGLFSLSRIFKEKKDKLILIDIRHDGKIFNSMTGYYNDMTYYSGDGNLIIVQVANDYNFKDVIWTRDDTPILTDKEREYLSTVIKPFRYRVVWIKKQDYYPDGQYIKIEIKKDVPVVFPLFEENKYYKNMEVDKEYTLEELGL